MKSYTIVLQEYKEHLNLILDQTEQNSIIEKAKSMVAEYKEKFLVNMQEPNFLKLYYFTAISLADVYKERSEDIYLLMLEFLNDVLYEKLPQESEDFYNRSVKKIAISIIKNRLREDYGAYGVYLIFSSVIRYFEVIHKEEYSEKKAFTYTKLLDIEKMITSLRKAYCPKNECVNMKFSCTKEEMVNLQNSKIGDVKIKSLYRYMLEECYKKEDMILRVERDDGVTYQLSAKYAGEVKVQKLDKKSASMFEEEGIQYVDEIFIDKIGIIT